MQRRWLIILFGCAVLIVGTMYFFPSEEAQVRRLLARLSQLNSFEGFEHPIERLKVAHALGAHCAETIRVIVDASDSEERSIRETLETRERVMESIVAMRAKLDSLAVKLFDIDVEVKDEIAHASLYVEARAYEQNSNERIGADLAVELQFEKSDGDWLITAAKVEDKTE